MHKFLVEVRNKDSWVLWAIWTQGTYRTALNNLIRLCAHSEQDINDFRIRRPSPSELEKAQQIINQRKNTHD